QLRPSRRAQVGQGFGQGQGEVGIALLVRPDLERQLRRWQAILRHSRNPEEANTALGDGGLPSLWAEPISRKRLTGAQPQLRETPDNMMTKSSTTEKVCQTI